MDLTQYTDHGSRERLHVVIAGHVDHGKSTVVGRLLADTNSLPHGKLDQVRAFCERTARPFEYAFLLDALRNERAQGITIDAARVFVHSGRREYVMFDAPGHLEFLKNMLTGASHATIALLVIDARAGVSENSRRHGYLLSMLGFRHVIVVVNKMDLVGYEELAFSNVIDACQAFLRRIDIAPTRFIPVSGRHGDNIVLTAPTMPWYAGPSVLSALDHLQPERTAIERPFRMPVQDVYKFTENGDERRIVAGRILSGRVTNGDELQFFPSGKRARVRRLESEGSEPPQSFAAGDACGFTLMDDVYIERGEMAARVGEFMPVVGRRIAVSVIWLGKEPLAEGGKCVLKHGSARVNARVESIERVIDMSTLGSRERATSIGRHEAAECVLNLAGNLAFDPVTELASGGHFVLVRDFDIQGGGIIRAALPGALPTSDNGHNAALGDSDHRGHTELQVL